MFVLFAAFELKSFAEHIVLRTMLLSDSHASVGMAIARLFFGNYSDPEIRASLRRRNAINHRFCSFGSIFLGGDVFVLNQL